MHYSKILTCLGKQLGDDEVFQFFENINENPEDDEVADNWLVKLYYESGFCFHIREAEDKIVQIELLSEGVNKFQTYQGDLPFDLVFGDDIETVKSKLAKSNSQSEIRFREFPKKTPYSAMFSFLVDDFTYCFYHGSSGDLQSVSFTTMNQDLN